ncbi:hypothetical protein [Floccifex sp.]|uniref:hypothetical protein n=1 Tax=Floccifex sp. TaxID=2815810 RepID=UPI003F051FF3
MKKKCAHKFYNGYSLYLSLICLFVLFQCISYFSVFTMQSAYLIQCNRQSNFDLALISHAKALIKNNTYVRSCSKDNSKLILRKDFEIENIPIVLTDHETYISCRYENLEVLIYYDNYFIYDLETKTVD